MTNPTRHDLSLDDLRDGDAVVTYHHVREHATSTVATHISETLPPECLTLFDGPRVEVDALSAEERRWIETEAPRIEFPDV